jgi:hypothetical protein
MNKFYFLKFSLIFITIIGFTFSVTFLQAQHLFSVNYNDLSRDNVTLLQNQVANSEISALSLTKNNENRDVYPVVFSSVENIKVVILNEENGSNVVITPAENAHTEFQLSLFFIEELKQAILGDALQYLVIETNLDFSVKNVSSISAAKNDVFIPQYFYGKKGNVKEALPKDRQIIHIFKEKPRFIPAFPNDPENLHYVAQLEEEMSYYVYMYKLPDGGLWIYDEHFNKDDNKNETRIGGNLVFTLSGNLNINQETATLHALDIWSEVLAGIVPVDINIMSTNMGAGVIGGSYRQPNYFNPETQTWYCSALGNQMAGYNVVPSQRDIRLEMNSQFNFYYGITGNPGGSQIDWITVMLHEVCHGLGFYPLVGTTGAYAYTTPSGGSTSTNYPGIYDRQLFQGLTGPCLTELTQTERAALVKSNNLYSGAPGSNLLEANSGVRIQMYAPSSWAGGSSVSHWNTNVTFSTFMKHSIAYGFKLHTIGTRKIGMMLDLGWTQPSNDPFIPVINIIEVPTTAFVGAPLILEGRVVPDNANNHTIIWSVNSAENTGATINGTTLNTTGVGSAIVTATIIDGTAVGTNYSKNFTIAVVKATQTAPNAPTLAEKTATSIRLNEMDNCEFRMNGGEWQTSTLFSYLNPNTIYHFVARKKETTTHLASPVSPMAQFTTNQAALAGMITITGNAVFGEVLLAEIFELYTIPEIPDFGELIFQWKREDVQIGTNSATYTLQQADIGFTISVILTASDCDGALTSAATENVTKAQQIEPEAPTLFNNTQTSITLNEMEGCEFRMDDGEWQAFTLFNDLSANTEYSFVARRAETVTHFYSPESLPALFSTEPLGIRETIFKNVHVYSYSNSVYIKNESSIALKSVEIMDMMGRVVYQSSITKNEMVISLLVANGIYNVRLISQDDDFAATKVSINK